MKKLLLIILPIVLALITALAVILLKDKADSADKDSSNISSPSQGNAMYSFTMVLKPDNGGLILEQNEIDSIIAGITERLKSYTDSSFEIVHKNGSYYITVTDSSDYNALSDDEKAEFLSTAEALFVKGVVEFREGTDKNGTLLLNNKDIKRAFGTIDPVVYTDIIQLEFTEAGSKKFAEATKRLIGNEISIWVDDICIFSPWVRTAIESGECYIDGIESATEAQVYAAIFESKPLPYGMTITSIE